MPCQNCNFQCLANTQSHCVILTPVLLYASIKMAGAADLQVADGWRIVDLDVGGVGSGQLEAVSEPNHRGSGVSFDLTADVGWVSLPCVHCHCTENLWSICSNTQGSEDGKHHTRPVWKT